MMEFLNFLFSSVWIFLGFIVLISIIFNFLIEIVSKIADVRKYRINFKSSENVDNFVNYLKQNGFAVVDVRNIVEEKKDDDSRNTSNDT